MKTKNIVFICCIFFIGSAASAFDGMIYTPASSTSNSSGNSSASSSSQGTTTNSSPSVSSVLSLDFSSWSSGISGCDDSKAEKIETDISASSKTDSSTFEASVNSAVQTGAAALRATGLSYPFTTSATELENIKTQVVETYIKNLKKNCTQKTEKTEYLCAEEKACGFAKAKSVLSTTSKFAATINSAQVGCSAASSVNAIAEGVLGVALAKCVAAKASCRTNCNNANTELDKINTNVQALEGKLSAEVAQNRIDCDANYAEAAITDGGAMMTTCNTEVTTKETSGKTAISNLKAAIQKEKPAATAGTSSNMNAVCESKASEILKITKNIDNISNLKKDADKCNKQLSTNSASNADTAKALGAYCARPENTESEFCKCQKNQNQQGCPGFGVAGAASGDNSTGNASAGTAIIMNSGGPSGFAGRPSDSPDAAKTSAATAANTSADSSAASLSDNPAAKTNAVNNPSAFSKNNSAYTGTDNSKDLAKNKKEENKKWSFGSFAASVGSMFGGNKNNKAAPARGLSAKGEEGLQRRIASDKFSAQVTGASGKSNWEKVRQVYLIKANTLPAEQ